LDVYKYNYSLDIPPQSLGIYYEWNGKDQKWMKLNDEDPDPSTQLEPGQYDGQIIEIPRASAK
jgi:hypothetical protein